MNRVRHALRTLLLAVALVTSLLVAPATARAASAYDDVLWHQSTIWLPVYHTGTWNYTYRDVTSSWNTLIPTGSAKTSFDDARDNSGHYVVVNGNNQLCVTWSTDPTVKTSFFMLSGQPSWGINSGDEWNYTCIHEESTGIVQYSGLNQSSRTVLLFGNKPSPLPSTPGGVVFSTYETVESGYEGEVLPTHAPPAKYVSMGDSFSVGEGNEPFEYGTANDGVNECHRSPQAYPRLLADDTSLSLGSTAFVACSGATTDNVINGQWNEPAQVDALSEDTETVTITIGGNDIKFNGFASACLYGSCASSSSQYQESWDIMTDVARSDYLPSQLESLFSAMSSHLWLNTNVKVYVVGYPYVMTDGSWGDRGVGICSDFDEDEATAAEAIVLKLNMVISTAVSDFDDSRFVYVNPLSVESPFLGYELCRSGAYFHGTEAAPVGPAGVFHPNQDGQQAYADLIEGYMD